MRLMAGGMMKIKIGLLMVGLLTGVVASAEVCTTQSQMTASDRDALATAARGLAAKVQANDVAGLQAATVSSMSKRTFPLGTTDPSGTARMRTGKRPS